jgi:creatinine amidohydrolase
MDRRPRDGVAPLATDLGAKTWPEFDGGRSGLLLVPLGATEQHGHHLPLATDTIIAEAWATAVAGRLDGSVVAPTLPFGSSGEHQGFPGTLSIGGPALRSVVVELVRSATSTFARVAFLSGHAGNDRDLRAAVEQLRGEGHHVVRFLPTWPGRHHGPVDAHAGRTETSLLLHLRPDLVRSDRAVGGDTRPLDQLLGLLRRDGVAAVSPTGVLGDPAGASADEGRRLFDDLVDRTVDGLGTG